MEENNRHNRFQTMVPYH